MGNAATVKIMAFGIVLAVAGCDDFDLRDNVGGFDTSSAATSATAPRPEPDARGVISYPGYQVVVAGRGDSVAAVASRLNLDAEELARFNGIGTDVTLRQGEIIALPRRVAESTESSVDIADLAGAAIDAAPADPLRTPAVVETETLPSAEQGPEPVRHKVERGETAFTISRLYNVPVRQLGEWNGLGPDLMIREGQFLLIPVANAAPPAQTSVTAPGAGTAAPTPPSAATPVPDTDAEPLAPVEAPEPAPVAAPADEGEFLTPVAGTVIRGYAPGRNEGVDFAAPAGTRVNAAEDGTVAAITRDTNNVAIIVIRHDGNLLTVYTQVDDLRVERGDRVRRGEQIASIKAGDPSFLHFEVRDGLESVDPALYLNL
ncbi:MAG: peptidoglycan DD-metalloendopeptidase family protein [Pseudomonadota bacterium]